MGCERFIELRDDLGDRLNEQPPPDGKEAEDLRAGIEALMQTSSEAGGWDDTVSVEALQNLLDVVDARDSLYHLQREDLAKTAQVIQEHKLSVIYYSDVAGGQFEVADKPPPGRPIRSIADDRKMSTGRSLAEAVETWLRDYAETSE